MPLSDAIILEFQQILKEEFGCDVSKKITVAIANGMVGYFDLLAQLNHQIEEKEDNEYESNDKFFG
jgi:hypothetical protein